MKNSGSHSAQLEIDLFGIVGVNDEERLKPQPLAISLSIELLEAESFCDEQESAMRALIISVVQDARPLLLEALAYQIVKHIIDRFSQVSSVLINIKKPWAIPKAAHAYVTLEMARG